MAFRISTGSFGFLKASACLSVKWTPFLHIVSRVLFPENDLGVSYKKDRRILSLLRVAAETPGRGWPKISMVVVTRATCCQNSTPISSAVQLLRAGAFLHGPQGVASWRLYRSPRALLEPPSPTPTRASRNLQASHTARRF